MKLQTSDDCEHSQKIAASVFNSLLWRLSCDTSSTHTPVISRASQSKYEIRTCDAQEQVTTPLVNFYRRGRYTNTRHRVKANGMAEISPTCGRLRRGREQFDENPHCVSEFACLERLGHSRHCPQIRMRPMTCDGCRGDSMTDSSKPNVLQVGELKSRPVRTYAVAMCQRW